MIPEINAQIKEEPLLLALWESLVKPGLTELDQAKKEVASLKPPTAEEIVELIDESDEPSIVSMRNDLEEAERLVEQLTEQLETWAKETLSVSATPDQRAAATQKFNRSKTQLKANLESMLIQAEKVELPEAIEFIRNVMEDVSPKTTTRISRSDTTAERAWLQEHHPEMKISDRGRIPAAAHELWLNRVHE